MQKSKTQHKWQRAGDSGCGGVGGGYTEHHYGDSNQEALGSEAGSERRA